MSLLNILRQRALCRTHLPTPFSITTRHVVSQRLTAHLRSPLQPTFSPKRLASSDAAAKARNPPSYPSLINIYRAGTPLTLFTGFFRLSTLVLFGIGTFLHAPTYLFAPFPSPLWTPLVILASAIPMVLSILVTGPVVHAIQLRLPTPARRSVSELKRFADSPPGDAVLRLHYMRLAPWPTVREVPFGRLRRVKPTLRGGVANLEYVPEHLKGHEGTVWFWLVQGFWGRHYVKRDQVVDRASVPGVLDKMWEQIPFKGSREDPLVRMERIADAGGQRRVVRMSGRPGVLSGREEGKKREVVPPPPPPPPEGRKR